MGLYTAIPKPDVFLLMLCRSHWLLKTVDIKHSSNQYMTLEWMGSAANDMIADSVLALLLGIEGSPATVKSMSE